MTYSKQSIKQKGVHIGTINNPSYLKDKSLADLLKQKTCGQLMNVFPFKSNDYESSQPKKGFVQYELRNLSHALSFCLKSNKNIQWMLLFAGGVVLSKKDPMFMWLDMLPQADNTTIAAYTHLLVPDDHSYFLIHPQMIAINTVILRRHIEKIIPKLDFKGEMNIGFKKYGDFHDKYTPFWVIPDSKIYKNVRVSPDSAWLAELINLGYSAFNISNETVRQSKSFFYMDSDSQIELGRSYMNGRQNKDLINSAQKIGKKTVMKELLKTDSIKLANMGETILLDNSNKKYMENLKENDFDCVLLPCAGFNYLKCYSVLKGSLKAFFHYDHVRQAVIWRKNTIENFDEKSLKKNLIELKDINTIGDIPFEYLKQFYKTENLNFLNHQYKVLDILSSWKELLLEVKTKGYQKVLFDLSNILCYDKTVYKEGLDFSGQIFKEIISFLNKNFSNWYVATDSFHYSKKYFQEFEDKDLYESDPINSRSFFYGYLIHKTKVNIPAGNVWKVWENSAVDFWTLFHIEPKKFEQKTKETLIQKNYDASSWKSFYNSSYLPAVPLKIEFDHEAFLTEAKAVFQKNLFSFYRFEDHYGWMSFVIHGLGDGRTKSYESYYPGKKEYLSAYHFVDSARKHCPKTVDFFEKEFGRQTGCHQFTRIRFMALLPGGFIPPHYDSFKSSDPGPINIALNNPKNCHFHMWRGSNFTPQSYYGCLPFSPGTALNIDVGNSHMVYNLSDEPRFHIIVHVQPMDERKAYYNFKTQSLRAYIHQILQN